MRRWRRVESLGPPGLAGLLLTACGLSLEPGAGQPPSSSDDIRPTDAGSSSGEDCTDLDLADACAQDACAEGLLTCAGNAHIAGCGLALTSHDVPGADVGAVWRALHGLPVTRSVRVEARITIPGGADHLPGDGFTVAFVQRAEPAAGAPSVTADVEQARLLGVGHLADYTGVAAYVRTYDDEGRGVLKLRSSVVPVSAAALDGWEAVPGEEQHTFAGTEDVFLLIRVQNTGQGSATVDLQRLPSADAGEGTSLGALDLDLGALARIDYVGVTAGRQDHAWSNSAHTLTSLRVVCAAAP